MIYLLGPRVCGNCNEVGAWLTEEGVPWEKVILNPVKHDTLVERAKSSGYLEAPIGCTKDNDGNFVYVAAGMSTFAKMSMKKAHRALVAA